MNEVLSLRKLESGLLNDPQIDQLITTNRALHAVVLELKSLLQTTVRQEGTYSVDAAEPHDPVIHEPTDDQVISSTCADNSRNFLFPNISVSEANEKAALAANVEQSKVDFERDNEQARRRHEKRRQQEILRLKNRVSYKCK